MKRQPFLVPSINDFILSFTDPSKAGTALSHHKEMPSDAWSSLARRSMNPGGHHQAPVVFSPTSYRRFLWIWLALLIEIFVEQLNGGRKNGRRGSKNQATGL